MDPPWDGGPTLAGLRAGAVVAHLSFAVAESLEDIEFQRPNWPSRFDICHSEILRDHKSSI